MKSYWIKVGPNPISPMSVQEGKTESQIETHRENSTWWHRQRLEWYSSKPRNAKDWWSPSETKKRQGRIFPFRFQRCMVLPTLWFCLYNSETINFCCFKLPCFWYFIMAALGNWYTTPCYYFLVERDSSLNIIEKLSRKLILLKQRIFFLLCTSVLNFLHSCVLSYTLVSLSGLQYCFILGFSRKYVSKRVCFYYF